MPEPGDVVSVAIRADTTEFRRELSEATRLGRDFGRSLTGALEGATLKGKGLTEVFRTLALSLSSAAFRSAFKPLEQTFSGALSGIGGGDLGYAKGGVFADQRPLPFARGGVISSPISFPMSGGMQGIAGERGAEAIMPLTRGPDGRLGVTSNGAHTVHVNFNVSATDAQSFMRSQGQIAAMLTRAVGRGQRNL